MKTFVISSSFPPYVSGSSTVLGNLLKHFPSGTFVVLAESKEPVDSTNRLECKYFSCSLKFRNIYLGGSLLYGFIQYFLIPIITLKAIRIIRQEKIDKIFSVYPKSIFFISSFLAHKITGKPLFVYMHDAWEEAVGNRRFNKVHKLIARMFERVIFRSASRIFAISDALGGLLSRKHNMQVITLPHCIDIPSEYRSNAEISKKNRDPYKIAFTGSLYFANLEPIKRLVDAINSLSVEKIRLILCIMPAEIQKLREWGIYGENVEARFTSRAEVLSLQREADILFLPLAFTSPGMEPEFQTIFPTKTPEYMISGTPILVYARSDYYLSRYAREKKWALVVDNQDTDSLRGAILRLVKDTELRRELIHNAWVTAATYDGISISRKLMKYLSMEH